MPYTYEQAIDELASLRANNAANETALFNLARQTSVDAAGAVTLLYSGDLPDGNPSSQAVQALVSAGHDVRVVDETAAARLLQSDEFKAALAQASGISIQDFNDPAFSHPAKDRLFHATDGPWADASRRFAQATIGEVRLMAHQADPSRTFALVELPALLQNNAVTSIEGIDIAELRERSSSEVFERVQRASQWGIAASGLTPSNFDDYISPQLLDRARYLETHVEANGRINAWIDSLPDAEKAELRTLSRAAMSVQEGTRLSAGARVLNKLGVFGSVLGFALAANDAEAAHAAGDTQRAKEIMKEWAVDAAGSEIGSLIGAAIGGVAVAAAAVAGVALAAPLAGAIVLGGALIGGFFGAEGAMEFYRQLDDSDDNRRRDIVDRLSNLLFGATSTLTTPLPADLNGARFTIDASLTRDEIVVQARTSIAWRYALRELNSFVITDVDYARHNADGSLDLYDEQTGQGAMTERFVQDRAAMLTWKLQFERDGARDADDGPRTGAKPYNEDWDTHAIQGNWDYVDLAVRLPGGQPLTLAIDGRGEAANDRHCSISKRRAA